MYNDPNETLKSLNIKSNKLAVNSNEFVVEMDKTRWQAVEKCKERFLRDGANPYDCEYMYPEIAASWIRSKKYGVDPYSKNLGYCLKPRELSALIRDKHALIDIASSFMQKHLGLLSSSGYHMCLTDENGILLVSAGEKTIVERFERINARPGAVTDSFQQAIGYSWSSPGAASNLQSPIIIYRYTQ
jgi:hypothetical protein